MEETEKTNERARGMQREGVVNFEASARSIGGGDVYRHRIAFTGAEWMKYFRTNRVSASCNLRDNLLGFRCVRSNE